MSWSAGYTGPYERPECDYKTETVDWDGSAYLVRPYSQAEIDAQWQLVRQQRDALLKSSDWTMIEDYDLGADRQAWAAYRQELRDLPALANPFNITWPALPI